MKHYDDEAETFEPIKPRKKRTPATAHFVDQRKRRLRHLHNLSKHLPKKRPE